MRLHVETLYRLDGSGRLQIINDPSEAPAPRLFFGRTPDGNVLAFRDDLSAGMVRELTDRASHIRAGLDTSAPLTELDSFAEVLDEDQAVENTWAGPNYHFPDTPFPTPEAVPVTPGNAYVLSPFLEAWLEDVGEATPMAAALHDDQAVSVCCSVRIWPGSDEAGVETHPEFRGRGLAVQSVAAWADAVRRAGRIPLYSTSWDNEPSQRVASKLGLIQYGSVLHIT